MTKKNCKNPNHPKKKDSNITVEPIREIKDINLLLSF